MRCQEEKVPLVIRACTSMRLRLRSTSTGPMVAAFGGYDCVMEAYNVAKQEGYRFGTYGDAMLII